MPDAPLQSARSGLVGRRYVVGAGFELLEGDVPAGIGAAHFVDDAGLKRGLDRLQIVMGDLWVLQVQAPLVDVGFLLGDVDFAVG